jgi:hypothetical protein
LCCFSVAGHWSSTKFESHWNTKSATNTARAAVKAAVAGVLVLYSRATRALAHTCFGTHVLWHTRALAHTCFGTHVLSESSGHNCLCALYVCSTYKGKPEACMQDYVEVF